MKKLYLLTFILHAFTFCFTADLFAQLPLAPEVWSSPEKMTVISNWATRAQEPTVSRNGKKLYFKGIAMTEKTDTGWTTPVMLNQNINQHLSHAPQISPDGKKLYISWAISNWAIFYSDWDTLLNDWGIPKDCGPGVNDPLEAVMGCCLPDDTTLIFLRTTTAYISHFNLQTQTWGPSTRWPTSVLWFTTDLGIYVNANRKKVYLTSQWADTTNSGTYYLNYDIVVNYKDTTNPMGYKPPKRLNFCRLADSLYAIGEYTGKLEGYPTLTADGKTIYFTADYHGQATIYVSHMLIDENGNPVSVRNENPISGVKEFELLQPYPNPFNPETTIEYTLNQETEIKLSIYDITGKEVKVIKKERESEGSYKIKFNAVQFSSGTYIAVLATPYGFDAKKIIFVK